MIIPGSFALIPALLLLGAATGAAIGRRRGLLMTVWYAIIGALAVVVFFAAVAAMFAMGGRR